MVFFMFLFLNGALIYIPTLSNTLTDVSITSPNSNSQILAYNSSAGKWQNDNNSGSGSSKFNVFQMCI